MLASTLLSFSMDASDERWMGSAPAPMAAHGRPGARTGATRTAGTGKPAGGHGVGLGEPHVKGLSMRIPLSVLDLAPITPGGTATDAIAASVALARRAEETGFQRVWYAEHHNMPSIASSATSVLIAHVGAHTSSIRLGAGGIMLPNHSPLTIAEQFGTLDAVYPARIDLGLGRAPGSDQNTMYALRRDERSADRFPQDVLELQAYLAGETRVPGVDAVPGKGSNLPLYVLGSSMFGATLAAALGLPYAFASHFAPQLLEDRKSTRLNSSHMSISYAVFCLKKKNNHITTYPYITTHYVVGLH